MTAQPQDWIKQVSPAILEQDQTPLFGKGPAFPWEKLSNELSHIFQTQSIRVKPHNSQWLDPGQIMEGLGEAPSSLNFSVSPLAGTLTWLMPKQDVETLMYSLLSQNPHHFEVIDPDFEQGFYHFLAAQVVQIIGKIDFDKNLSPSLHVEPVSFEKPCFCIDLLLQLSNRELNGRVVLSPELCQSWREKFANRQLAIDYDSPLAQKLQTIVHLEAGRTELSREEWEHVTPGDFIVLDFCSYEPDSDKGRVMLTVEGVPLFRARLKQGSLKILEFPLYHEVGTSMSKKEHEDEEEDFEESEVEETEEEDFDEDEDEEDEDEDEDEEEDEEDLTEESEVEGKEKAPSPKGAQAAAPAAKAEKNEVVKPEELSLTIVVEVGRVQVSIQKLMKLQPGNVLDLSVYPENGVDLIVNGRCVGKGELLKVGETLGVRVLDIG